MDEYQIELDGRAIISENLCPACSKPMQESAQECLSCGVVVNKFNSIQHEKGVKESIGGVDHLSLENIKALEKGWKKVVVNYHDKETHHQFMHSCYEQRALPYAIHCYSRMLEIDSDDDIAILMRRQALSMVSVDFKGRKEVSQVQPPVGTIPILKWVNWTGLFMSSFCIVAGTLAPQARNLIGLGASFLVLFIALFIYRKKSSLL